MTHASLFSGIDGFGLAALWMGWENLFTCEIDEFCNIILEHYYKDATHYKDIKSTDFSIWRGRIDVLSGGFPCQPYSVAGKRLGKNDDRHLWPEMFRAIREIQPRWVVGENVRGIINWNGGLVFDEVCADLEALGYEVLPILLPAAGVNAPHERYRTFFVAYSDRNDAGRCGFRETGRTERKSEVEQKKREWLWGEFERTCKERTIADTTSEGLQGGVPRNSVVPSKRPEDGVASHPHKLNGNLSGLPAGEISPGVFESITHSNGRRQSGKEYWQKESGFFAEESIPADWRDFPTQSPVCNGDDGVSTELLRRRIRDNSMGLLSEKEIDQILSKAANKLRIEAIKAGGNAVVPPLIFRIYKTIQEYENLNNKKREL